MAANGNGEMAMNGNGAATARKPKGLLPSITTSDKHHDVCHDMSAPTVKAQTIDELHSLQKKKSAPTTPIKGFQSTFAALSEEERQKQQLQSIRLFIFLVHSLYARYIIIKIIIPFSSFLS